MKAIDTFTPRLAEGRRTGADWYCALSGILLLTTAGLAARAAPGEESPVGVEAAPREEAGTRKSRDAPLPVAEIVYAYLRENGGRHRIDSLTSVRLDGTLEVDGKVTPFRMVKKRPAKMFLLLETANAEMVTRFNGKTVRREARFDDGRVLELEMSEAEKAAFIDTAMFESLLVRSVATPGAIETAERKRVDGVLCHVLEIDDAGEEHTMYLEPVHYREVLIQTRLGDKTSVSRFGDYRKVDGIWLPFRIETEEGGSRTVIRVENAAVNVGVFDSFFD